MTNTTGSEPKPYTPSRDLTRAITAWKDAVALEERLRQAVRQAIAIELATTTVTNAVLADHEDFPWTQETVRGIAREYDTPRRRAPQITRKPKTTDSAQDAAA